MLNYKSRDPSETETEETKITGNFTVLFLHELYISA